MPEIRAPLSFRPEALLHEFLADGLSAAIPVTGASMAPFIRSHDVITLAPLGSRPIHRGDIVAFQRPDGRLVVHRVIGLSSSRILTRGDATSGDDGWIDQEKVIGGVEGIERDGQPVRLGLGRGRSMIAVLSRVGLLLPLLRPLRWLVRPSTSRRRT